MQDATFSPFDLVPGKEVAGRFQIEGASRQNGFGTAFLAHDKQEDRPCELIVFASNLFDGAEQAEEYRRALAPWTEVDSAHVARVHEVLLLGGDTLVQVCERPEGVPLRARLKESGRSEAGVAVRFGMELLQGVLAIHERGLVHGDIKPQTIHVTAEEGGSELHGILLDGGVTGGLWSAKHLGDRTALIGTPFYAPVEQFGGEAPDVQSDVYNVATVLFELITGVLPWPGKSLLEVFQAKLDKRPPVIAVRAPEVEVDLDLERVLTRGLLADRSERYQSAAAFLAGLEPFANA